MSENLIRSNPDFSKYDSMTIEELEEILRADAQGPERDDSDVDEILYVMEVLAKKRRQNGIAVKTALEAYREFQQNYLPMVEEEKDIESVSKRKSTVIPFRRFTAIAASLVLVFTLTTSANAFGWKDIWNAVARWAEETFSFSMGVEVSEPTPTDMLKHSSLEEVLIESNITIPLVPQWIPNRFEFNEIIIDENPRQKIFIASYLNDDEMLKVSIQSYLSDRPEQIEVSGVLIEMYTASNINYYIIENNGIIQAAWIVDMYECCISGTTTIDELKQMIDSIQKG